VNPPDLVAFAQQVMARLPDLGAELPPADAPYWLGVGEALKRYPKSPGWELRLLGCLQLRKIRGADGLPPAIAEEAKAAREQNINAGPACDRAEAEKQSRGCPQPGCCGGGLVSVRHPLGYPVAAACVCPMGRWIWAHTDEQTKKRLADLSALPELIDQDWTDRDREVDRHWANLRPAEQDEWKREVCRAYPEMVEAIREGRRGAVWMKSVCKRRAMDACYRAEVEGLAPFAGHPDYDLAAAS
jgi:hypothetical protein